MSSSTLLKRQSVASPVPMASSPASTSTLTTSTPSATQSKADVLNAPLWPTVSVPAGFTLAAGVQITPLPAIALSSVTGSAALSAAIATAATPAADPATWNNEAGQKCAEAVAKLGGKASNPSGLAACYNLPYLDNTKGTFEAEVRIFNVSAATGDFVSVAQGSMMLNLEYANASLTVRDLVPRAEAAGGGREQLLERERHPERPGGLWMATQIMVQKYIVRKSTLRPLARPA